VNLVAASLGDGSRHGVPNATEGLLHPDHVVACARLYELNRQRTVLLEERGRTIRIRDHGTSGLVRSDLVAASNDLLDRDLTRGTARVCEGHARREGVEKS